MRLKYGFGETSSFEQRETQQHSVAHAGPDRHDDVVLGGDVLHQDGVDRHTDDKGV